MVRRAAVSCLGLLAGASSPRAAPGDFDLYVEQVTWQPELCYGQEWHYPGCASPSTFESANLTAYGLWPASPRAGGMVYPMNCSTEPFDIMLVNDRTALLWPNNEANISDWADYTKAWKRSWEAHGTCTGLAQSDYFATVLASAQNGTPAAIRANVGRTVSTSVLVTAFGGSDMVALGCQKGKYLVSVTRCWSKAAALPC